jgi:hypothetical protein
LVDHAELERFSLFRLVDSFVLVLIDAVAGFERIAPEGAVIARIDIDIEDAPRRFLES